MYRSQKVIWCGLVVFSMTGCGGGPVQQENLQPDGNSLASNSVNETYEQSIQEQFQTSLLDAVTSKDRRYLFVLEKSDNGGEELQLWNRQSQRYDTTLAKVGNDRHIESIVPMDSNRLMFLVVVDGGDRRSGQVVVMDYLQKKMLGTYILDQLPSNYYTNVNVDVNNQNVVNIGDISIDFSDASFPVATQSPVSLQVNDSTGENRDNDIRNYFGDDLVMAVPTLQKQGLFVVKRKPHQTQALELYGLIGGIEYEYTLLEVTDGERIARIIPQSNGQVVFIVTADIAPAGYAKIITYNYANKYKMSEKSVYDLYDPSTYVVGQYTNASTSSSPNHQDSDYSTGSAWANSNAGYTYPSQDSDGYVYDDSPSSSGSPSDLYEQMHYGNSDYSTGSPSVNSDSQSSLDTGDHSISNDDYYETSHVTDSYVILKQGTWQGTGHQTWKREHDFQIELTIGDNEYYFNYIGDNYKCYGSLRIKSRDANSITFREYIDDGMCAENYFVLTKITDYHYSYESYLLDGTHTVSGDVYYSPSHMTY